MDIFRYTERNPESERAHKKEVLWQITLPFILGLLVILALCGVITAIAVQGPGNLSDWADVSLIVLIFPALLMTLIFTAALGAIVYGVMKLIGVLPKYFYKAHNAIINLKLKIVQFSDAAAEPVVKSNTLAAAIKTLFGRRN